MAPLYILEDAHGFTTAVRADPSMIFNEYRRLRLTRPIRVHHWVRNGSKDREGWKKASEFVWGGEDVGL